MSAENTVWDHEILIDDIYGKQIINEKRFEALEKISETNIAIANRTVTALTKLTLDQATINQNLPALLRAVTDASIEQRRDADLLLELVASLKDRQVNLGALIKLHPNLLEVDDMAPMTIRLQIAHHDSASNNYKLQFEALVKNENINAYKAVVFKSWHSNVSLDEYIGPTIMLHNFNLNCTKLTREPGGRITKNTLQSMTTVPTLIEPSHVPS